MSTDIIFECHPCLQNQMEHVQNWDSQRFGQQGTLWWIKKSCFGSNQYPGKGNWLNFKCKVL